MILRALRGTVLYIFGDTVPGKKKLIIIISIQSACFQIHIALPYKMTKNGVSLIFFFFSGDERRTMRPKYHLA